jgi:hypothetical protein
VFCKKRARSLCEATSQRLLANDPKFTDVGFVVTDLPSTGEAGKADPGSVYTNIRIIQRRQPMNLTKFISFLLI